jgi:hypothetical protein
MGRCDRPLFLSSTQQEPHAMTLRRIVILLAIGLGIALLVSSIGSSGIAGEDVARLLYGVVLAGLASTWVLAEKHGSLGETLRNILIWGTIIAAVAFAYSYKANFGF